MSSATKTLRFYFDYISSNAYLAWRALPPLVARHALTVEPVPVLFAGLLEAHGGLGPAEIPAKIHWMWKNNLRKAALLRVPLQPPVHHPFNPLLSLRISSLPLPDVQRTALIDGLFDAVWAESRHVSEAAVVEEIARRAGLDGPALLEQAQTPENKARLRRQTEEAIAQGVFGVPTMQVGSELFWGYDDLPYLEHLLAGSDPLDPKEVPRWNRAPTPSAVRRRFRSDAAES